MLLHGQSKLKDAETVYMRYLYDKHKKELPKLSNLRKQQMQVDDSEEEEEPESDNSQREVKFY